MKKALKIGAATAAFGIFHSLLASQAVKDAAARLVGRRGRDATYRVFYNAQSVATFSLLLLYASAQPTRTLYHVRGPAAGLLRGAQLGGLLWAVLAAREVGILRLAGVTNLGAYLKRAPMPEGPGAQGPERRSSGALSTGGPFRWSRHPLNFAPVPVFWLTPRLTERRLAFNLVATAYLVLGSLHEERRLRALYGFDYVAYQRSGIPFFVPRPPRATTTPELRELS